MTITLNNNNNNDIISFPLRSSIKTSQHNDQEEFVLYSARHGAAVIVSCCNELEFLDLEQQLLQSNNNHYLDNLPLCDKNIDDLPQENEEDSFDNYLMNNDDESSISSYSCISEEEDVLLSEDTQTQVAVSSYVKKVHFAETLVSDVWTRPRTPSEECKVLFYSYEDTQRFRHEYRLERKLQQSSYNDPATLQVASSNKNQTESSNANGSRHSISRVVVVHNNTLETFYDEKQQDNYQPKTTSFVLPESNDTSSKSNAAIFDNDSFWSGSISWY